ncbi:MAG: hypothetical protein ACE5KA_06035 [Nitrososphaerales archaeon]
MSFLFRGRNKKKAKSVVKEWEKSQVSNIVKDIAKIIPQRAPLLRDIAATSLASLINKNLEFLTDEPKEVSGNLYSIIDTVKVKVGPGIPFIGKQFTLSIKYNVEVDVKEKKIMGAKPDISSFQIDFV